MARATATKKVKATKEEVSTAYHEAGHAVAAYLLKRSFNYVTIVPDEEKGSLGHVRFRGFGENFDPAFDYSPQMRLRLEREIICSLAGDAAESIHLGRRIGGSYGAGRCLPLA